MAALKSIIRDFAKKYGQSADKMEQMVFELIKGGMAPDRAVGKAFRDLGFGARVSSEIRSSQIQAAESGLGIKLAKTATVVKALNSTWSGDGVKFSQKLHGTSTAMREAMVSTIGNQIKINATISQLTSALFDGYGYGRVTREQDIPKYLQTIATLARHTNLDEEDKNLLLRATRIAQRNIEGLKDGSNLQIAYKGLVKAVKAGTGKNLARAVHVAVQEKSREIAARIARTESARAYFEGFIAANQDNDMVVAYQWELGSSHPDVDICDMYAEADMYNLGPGVYPKNAVPALPVHPNCLCMLSPVFKGEIDMGKQKDNTQKAGRGWLDKLSSHNRSNILGTKGSTEFTTSGKWQKTARNFNGFTKHESRLFNLDLQLHGKRDTIIAKSKKYISDEIVLPKHEYAELMSELRTNLTKRQIKDGVYHAEVGDFVYTVSYKDGDFKVLNKDFIESVWLNILEDIKEK